jgi:hypothetical protein
MYNIISYSYYENFKIQWTKTTSPFTYMATSVMQTCKHMVI